MFSNDVSAEIQYPAAIMQRNTSQLDRMQWKWEIWSEVYRLWPMRKIMRELGLCFSSSVFSKHCITEGICGEAIPRRTSEFHCIKGDWIDSRALLRKCRTSFYQEKGYVRWLSKLHLYFFPPTTILLKLLQTIGLDAEFCSFLSQLWQSQNTV